MQPSIAELAGKTFNHVVGMEKGSCEIFFYGEVAYKMYHQQDCCEDVRIEDVCGDVEDLEGVPIIEAYCESSSEDESDSEDDSYGTHTWTFYRLRTIKGTVTLRWYGESNGYYSEGVDIERLEV